MEATFAGDTSKEQKAHVGVPLTSERPLRYFVPIGLEYADFDASPRRTVTSGNMDSVGIIRGNVIVAR